MAEVVAFPWHELEPALARGSIADALAVADEAFDVGRLPQVVHALFTAEVEALGISARRVGPAPTVAPFTARLVTSMLELRVSAEPELVAFALTRLLNRPFRVAADTASVSPPLLGAWHAMVFELGRRLCRGEPPELLQQADTAPAHASLETWVRIDGRSFRVGLALLPRVPRTRPATRDVPLRLSLVAARVALSHAEVGSLRVGDAVLPGEGWFDERNPGSVVVAIAPDNEHGFRLSVTNALRYVERAELPHEQELPEVSVDDVTKESILADTPVVVRVEIASIVLSARECMSLSPGDVLSCGVPPRGPVVLRAAGREIARGELVTVEGELGVRIVGLGNEAAEGTGSGGE